MHTLVQMVHARHDFSFCVEIVLNHGPSASTSAPDVRRRGVQNFEGPESRPPGPATALPYTWGDYYIKLNNSVLLKPKIAFSTDFFSRGPKIAVDELRVHTLVQMVHAA